MIELQVEKGETLSRFRVEAFGSLPAMEFRCLADGRVLFRYAIGEGVEAALKYPGFDGEWRVMSEWDRRETMCIGGRVAEWLRSLDGEGDN